MMQNIWKGNKKYHSLNIFIFCVSFFLLLIEKLMGDDGKELFTRENCTKCHSIKSEGIEPQKESLLKGRKIIDHSGVGLRRDSEWIQKWLKKEIENEKGRKHKVKWKGSDEELKILAEFLSHLKKEIPEEELKKWYQDLLNSSR